MLMWLEGWKVGELEGWKVTRFLDKNCIQQILQPSNQKLSNPPTFQLSNLERKGMAQKDDAG